jgi:hypothetical protein
MNATLFLAADKSGKTGANEGYQTASSIINTLCARDNSRIAGESLMTVILHQ